MNVQGVFDRVKHKFGDESGVQIAEEDIIRWINDAQNEIVMHNESVLEAEITDNLVKGQQVYTFPTDLLILRSVRIKDVSTAVYYAAIAYSLQEFDRRVQGWDGSTFTGKSCFYTTYQRNIYLFPVPDAAIANGLKILYSKKPTDVVLSTDELALPLLYHNSIVEFCMSQAHETDEDYEAAVLHSAKFQESVRRLSHREQRGAREFYPSITVLPEDL